MPSQSSATFFRRASFSAWNVGQIGTSAVQCKWTTLEGSLSSSLNPYSWSSKSIPLLHVRGGQPSAEMWTYSTTSSIFSSFILSTIPSILSGSMRPLPFVISTIFRLYFSFLQYRVIMSIAKIRDDIALPSLVRLRIRRIKYVRAYRLLRRYCSAWLVYGAFLFAALES